MKFSRFLMTSFAAIGLSISANAADLRVGLKSEPSSIDPHYHNLGTNNGFATNIFGTLVVSYENPQHYHDLAVSW